MFDPILPRVSSLFSSPSTVLTILVVCATFPLRAVAQDNPITARFEPGCDGVRVLFTANVQAVSYGWSWSTGATSSVPAPVLEVPFGQAVSVILTTVNAAGESFTFSETYPASEQVDLSAMIIPNVMTPNGDGINDVFTLTDGPFLGPCAELSIFDRYGRKVYENRGNDLSWDGRSPAGEECIPAVYFYVLEVNSVAFTGHLTLFR